MSTVGINNRRLFAEDYTSSGQSRWAKSKGDSWRTFLLAQLRCDLVASERVIIPDTHLLDGSFFMSFRPEELSEALGTGEGAERRGLEIRMRQSSIRDTLSNWLIRPGSDRLNEFPFKLFSDKKTRGVIAKMIGLTPVDLWHKFMTSADHNPAKALAELLRNTIKLAQLEQPATDAALHTVAHAEEAWSHWQEMRPGTFYTQKWDGEFKLGAALGHDPIKNDLKTPECREIYTQIIGAVKSGNKYRSDANKVISATGKESAKIEAERAMIDAWYSRARYRAIAHQHRCSFVYNAATSNEVGNAQFALKNDPTNASQVRLPDEFYQRLASASGSDFKQALASASIHLQHWWRAGDVSYLRKGVDSLIDDLDVRPAGAFPPYVQKYITCGATIIAAKGVASGWMLEPSLIAGMVCLGGLLAERYSQERFRTRVVEAIQDRTA